MKKVWILSIFLLLAIVISFFLGVNLGYAKIPTSEVMEIIQAKLNLGGSLEGIRASTVDIVTFIRLPRLILAIIVGMSLATSGVVMQAVVRNPLADPYILGISSGAALGATLAILFKLGQSIGPNFVGFSAFIMAFIVAILVVFLANIGGRATSTKLLLSGLALSTVASSFSSLLIYLSSNRDAARQVTFWLLGSLSGAKWEQIKFIGPIIFLSAMFFWTQYRTLNLMLLGDEVSITMGKDLNKSRHIYILVASAMIGFVVYVSGVLGFVGLIVPHIARMIVGTDHKRLVPVSMLMGALLLLWADIISRIIIPGAELPTGVIISVVGAPMFIYLIVSKSYGGKKR
ncbi:MAG: iron ABC transporter permease [Tissierellia bacterium]|nr:iron ABC transporter permease [Tissierellia bacterium]